MWLEKLQPPLCPSSAPLQSPQRHVASTQQVKKQPSLLQLKAGEKQDWPASCFGYEPRVHVRLVIWEQERANKPLFSGVNVILALGKGTDGAGRRSLPLSATHLAPACVRVYTCRPRPACLISPLGE